jgi:PEGA domain-containing protein
VLSKRVIVLSSDKSLAKRMAAGVMAAGAVVEPFASPEELPKTEIVADLAVVHVGASPGAAIGKLAARLAAETPLVAVIPTSSLHAVVEAMASGRVAAVLVADTFEPAQLSKVASRLLYGDLFGLEKIVPWGVKVYAALVGDYQEKSVAIATVSEFAAAMGVRRKYREAIEQCLDELLMNALYDAPVDAAGKQAFADVPTKTRISLRMEQKAVVQYACDGNMFALSVRDGFGTLRSETILHYLEKCVNTQGHDQLDRKAGGAGLGLYLVSSASTEFVIALYPGVATEATCTFDLDAPKVQLKELGIFQEKIDATGRLAAGPPQRVGKAPTGPMYPVGLVPGGPFASARGITWLLGAAILLLLALIAVVAYPRLNPAPRGAIAVTTAPAGATIKIDGVAKGTTGKDPVVVPDLVVGQKYEIAAVYPGYEPQIEIVTPKTRNQTTALDLRLRPLGAVLVVSSLPAGATLTIDAQTVGATPATLTDLIPGSEHAARVHKVGYQELITRLRVPEPGARAEVQLALAPANDVALLRIESDPPGAEVLQGAEVLAGVVTPVAEQVVRVGHSYSFTLRLAGYMPETRTVTVRPGEPLDPVSVKLSPGGSLTVTTNLPDARLSVGTVAACQGQTAAKPGAPIVCPLPDGAYRARLASARPWLVETFEVNMRGGDLERKLDYGFVETSSNEVSLRIPGGPAECHKAAFPDGPHLLTLVTKTGQTFTKGVRVVAGRTVRVDAAQ